ncbi:MAG: DUF933 domain-containing protein [Planctomycetota bacterium]
MRIAMIGLPSSGKTTLFDAVTGRQDEPGAYVAPGAIHVGTVDVADERLDFLFDEIFDAKKKVPAQVECVDLGGLFTGDKPEPNAVEALRDADALVKVVRAFTDPAHPHPKGSVDPARDLEDLNAELFIVDVDIIERRIERLRESVTKPTPKQEQEKAELALLERCRTQLDAVGALDQLDVSEDEAKVLRGFCFLTQKPSVTVVNIGEDQLGDEQAAIEGLGETHGPALAVTAEIEKELLDLEPDERAPFLADYGLAALSAQRVVHAALEALDMITFFTGGEKEVRAWLIPRGSTALEAADKVHTDMARGFIRAEVVSVADLREHGSFKDVRAAGKERLEGKDHIVADGDVLHIRFSA